LTTLLTRLLAALTTLLTGLVLPALLLLVTLLTTLVLLAALVLLVLVIRIWIVHRLFPLMLNHLTQFNRWLCASFLMSFDTTLSSREATASFVGSTRIYGGRINLSRLTYSFDVFGRHQAFRGSTLSLIASTLPASSTKGRS
jgi:hypothetical protein